MLEVSIVVVGGGGGFLPGATIVEAVVVVVGVEVGTSVMGGGDESSKSIRSPGAVAG